MFHYTQAVIRNLKKINIFSIYKNNEEFKRLVRLTLALPLIDRNMMIQIWDRLNIELKAYSKEFVEYINTTWFTKPDNMWSFYKKDVRTTNAVEAFHSFLKK